MYYRLDLSSYQLAQAVALDAGSALGHYRHGMALFNLGEYAEALPCFRKATAMPSAAVRRVV